MNNIESSYLDLLSDVLENGEEKVDRTGVGTRSVFGRQIRGNLADGFPLLTTKQTYFKPILSELLWFIEGSGDERRLAEILHGTRDPEKKTIWTANANAPYWKGTYPGDLGRVYGVQWRTWKKYSLKQAEDYLTHDNGAVTYFNAKVQVEEVDQLAQIVKTLRGIAANDPSSASGARRMILTAWNPAEIDMMALPPCHMTAQFHVSTKKKLNCQLYIRSNDLFLGAPFNIASYALLTHILAQVSGLEPGELVYTIGDAHIYLDHIHQVGQQTMRTPFPFPTLEINPNRRELHEFSMSDFKVVGYEHHPALSGKMAV